MRSHIATLFIFLDLFVLIYIQLIDTIVWHVHSFVVSSSSFFLDFRFFNMGRLSLPNFIYFGLSGTNLIPLIFLSVRLYINFVMVFLHFSPRS